MSPVGCPTAGHKILIVLINAWSKKKRKKKDMRTKKKNVLFVTPVEKSKRFQFKLIIMLIVSGGVNEPNETNCFKRHRKGRKKTSEPSVTQSHWKKNCLFPQHI